MFNNITESLRPKHVGVDLLHGKIKAFEIKNNFLIDSSVEELLPGIVNPMNFNSFWHDANALKKILTYIRKGLKNSISRSNLFIAFPSEIRSSEEKKLIFKAAAKSGWNRTAIIDSFLCAAAGSEVGINECKRKIFIFCMENLTYIGLLYAGGAFYVEIINRCCNELTETDLKNSIEQLLNHVSIELPDFFTKAKIPKKDLEEVTEGWKLEIEKKIYLSSPYQLRESLGYELGEYDLVYLDYEDVILKGLKVIMSKVTKA